VVPLDWATCPLIIGHPMTHVNTVLANNRPMKMCHIIQLPCHHDGTDPATSPYGLYGQVQSASKNFACLPWRTDRDIFSIRTPFEKVNIPPESGTLVQRKSINLCRPLLRNIDFACRPYPQFVSESHDTMVLSCTLALLSSLVGHLEPNNRHFIIGR
jgi:hypothetical protein